MPAPKRSQAVAAFEAARDRYEQAKQLQLMCARDMNERWTQLTNKQREACLPETRTLT